MGLLTPPACGPAYIDTNAITYCVEGLEPYRELLAPMWQDARAGRFAPASSEFVILKALIGTLRDDTALLEMLIRPIFASAETELILSTLVIWEAAAWIRAQGGWGLPAHFTPRWPIARSHVLRHQ